MATARKKQKSRASHSGERAAGVEFTENIPSPLAVLSRMQTLKLDRMMRRSCMKAERPEIEHHVD